MAAKRFKGYKLGYFWMRDGDFFRRRVGGDRKDCPDRCRPDRIQGRSPLATGLSCIDPAVVGRLRTLSRHDILIHAKEIIGIVFLFNFCQPVVIMLVACFDTILAFVHDKVQVGASRRMGM